MDSSVFPFNLLSMLTRIGEESSLLDHLDLTGFSLQEEGDELTWVQRCRPGEDVILGHCDGSVARYNVDLFRPMSRGARGLQASRLREGNQVLGISTLQQVGSVFCQVKQQFLG